MYDNHQLIKRFIKGETSGTASNMFIDGDILYSYGYHYPAAVRLEDGSFMINNREYSVTTNRHLAAISRFVDNYIEINISNWGEKYDLKSVKIVSKHANLMK